MFMLITFYIQSNYTEQLSSISPEPPSIHLPYLLFPVGSLETAEDIPVKETPWTVSLKQLNIFAGVFAAIGSVIYFSLLLIIYCICEKASIIRQINKLGNTSLLYLYRNIY